MFNSALSNVGREEGPLENVAFYFLACLARVDKEAHNIYYLSYLSLLNCQISSVPGRLM